MDSTKSLTLRDGRTLSYAEYGSFDGLPLIVFHGMPGSHILVQMLVPAARDTGIRIIAPDRPGYSASSPNPDGTLLGYVEDITELADALKLERFAVMGVSGGGPYALACAYLMAHRLTFATVVSGIGMLRLPHSMQGMASLNRLMFTLGHVSPSLAALLLEKLIKSGLPKMQEQVQAGTSPSPDIAPELFALMVADQCEAISAGSNGLHFDMKMFWQPWGFQLEAIRANVILWHGEADNLAPAALAHQIADRIAGCEASFFPGEGHIDPLLKHSADLFHRIAVGSTQVN